MDKLGAKVWQNDVEGGGGQTFAREGGQVKRCYGKLLEGTKNGVITSHISQKISLVNAFAKMILD